MTLHHVHIVPNGKRFNLRAGLYKGFVGWQTAEAADLPVKTRDEHGKPITHCLDNLTKKQAEDLAQKLDAWFVTIGAFTPPSQRRSTARDRKQGDMTEKYRQAMGSSATTGGSRFT